MGTEVNKSNTRRFTWDSPVIWNGNLYPTGIYPIMDDQGNTRNRTVFVDEGNQYHTINDEGREVPMALTYQLPEVTVTGHRPMKSAESHANDLLTLSNDMTQVNNFPHRRYNPNLDYQTQQGAKSNAAWREEHPNAAAWGDALGAVPFAVAAYPFVAGAGSALGATTFGTDMAAMGQALMEAPLVQTANMGLGAYGLYNGAKDIANGRFTPKTAMDLTFFGQAARPLINLSSHLANNIRDYHNLNKFINRYGYNEYNPKIGLIFDDEKLDKLTNQLVKQHNTFTRGISVDEARKYYGFSNDWTDEQIAEYTLTHPHKPTEVNGGGNPNLEPVLYTSNSLDLSQVYTNGGNGYVGILQRPIVYDTNRSKMLRMNDFRFNKQLVSPGTQNLSVTTDEPYILPLGKKVPNYLRVKGGMAYKRKGKVISEYTPVEPTSLDAYANAGSSYIATRNPDDLDFRHYLWFGNPDDELLELKGMFRHSAPKSSSSVDYARHSVGFSKKKALGGKL